MTPEQIASVLRTHAPMVRKAASDLMGRVPANVELDDLVQVGMIALWQACYHFNSEAGASIGTFAAHRVRGAMLDALRASDTMSRKQRKQVREVAAASVGLSHILGREPTLSELAKAAGLSLDECGWAQVGSVICSLSDAQEVADPATPHGMHEQARMLLDVAKAIERLPSTERLIVEQHIDQDRTLADIAQERGVTGARICQVYQRAMRRLRSSLKLDSGECSGLMPT